MDGHRQSRRHRRAPHPEITLRTHNDEVLAVLEQLATTSVSSRCSRRAARLACSGGRLVVRDARGRSENEPRRGKLARRKGEWNGIQQDGWIAPVTGGDLAAHRMRGAAVRAWPDDRARSRGRADAVSGQHVLAGSGLELHIRSGLELRADP